MAYKTCPNCGNKVPTTNVVCPYCGYRFQQNANGGMLLALAFVLALLVAPIIVVLGMFGKFLLKGLYKNALQIEEFKKFRKTYTIICLGWFVVGIALSVLMFTLSPDLAEYGLYPFAIGNVVVFALSIVFGNKIYKKHKDDIPAEPDASCEAASNDELVEIEDTAADTSADESAVDSPISLGSDEYGSKKKMFELLTELAALRNANILTEEEFNEQKRQILSARYEPAPQQVTTEKVKNKEASPKVGPSTVSNAKAGEKKAKHQGLAKSLSIVGLIITILTVITFVVGTVFLCTARINVLLEYNMDGTQNWITDNFIAAAFSSWDISVLCLFTIIGAILMLVVLSAKLRAEIKRSQDDNQTIVSDILTLLVAAVPIVFSALTVDYYVNAGLLLFLILSASCGILIAMHLVLLLIKKVV